ncbi:MAG: DUF59 domain-containing protein [Sphingomonadaceae bacterium]|nr:DUF59 domain-containing protein [Sphingomonadaceae bacterium]
MLVADVMDEQIRDILACIYDPCSIAAGRPVSVLDMGLVRRWELHHRTLSITFCVTFAGCTMAPHFTEAAARDLTQIDGIDRVETHIDTDFAWTPELMTSGQLTMTGQPQAWRNRLTP